MNVDIDQKRDRRQSRWIIGLPVLSVVVDTAVVFGALGWLYVAIIGVVRPNDLPFWIVSWIPVRRDTVGIICFGLSATAYFLGGALEPSREAGMPNLVLPVYGDGDRNATQARGRSCAVARASLRTLFIYSTMTVIFLMVQTVTHPETLAMPLTHLLNWPTERSAVVLALLCSIASFILLRTSRHMSKLHNGHNEVDPN
jgi:hypothetical protein